MNFDFSEEQKLLGNYARKFLGKHCGTEVVRRILDGDEPFDQDVWKGLVELGWPGTAVPESYGGVGYGYLELCVTAQELGRALAPVPFSSSVYLATEALLLAGTDGQRETYLPRLVAGETIGTLALAEAPHPPTLNTLSTEVRDGKLYGIRPAVRPAVRPALQSPVAVWPRHSTLNIPGHATPLEKPDGLQRQARRGTLPTRGPRLARPERRTKIGRAASCRRGRTRRI